MQERLEAVRAGENISHSHRVHPRTETTRILIADDHPIIRYGLRRLLEAEPGLSVAGEADNGEEAVRLARELEPEILLMDLAMPRLSGLDALRELAKTPTPVRILMLAEVVEKDQMVKALQLGARGVVLKESATQILLESIWSVKRGQYWVGRESVPSLVQALRDFYPRVKDEQRRNFNLTPRELQTVAAVTAGYTNKGIALKFSLSEQTVKHHLTSIFSKLSVTNRLELVIFSITHRLTGGL